MPLTSALGLAAARARARPVHSTSTHYVYSLLYSPSAEYPLSAEYRQGGHRRPEKEREKGHEGDKGEKERGNKSEPLMYTNGVPDFGMQTEEKG